MSSNEFIDINKGFRRVGSFPAFADESFCSYADANAYAHQGQSGGSAHPGQRISVVTNAEAPKLYIVDNNYNLSEVIGSGGGGVNTQSISFNYSSFSGSGSLSVTLQEGFFLDTLTLRIIEGFRNDDAVAVVMYKESNPSDIRYLFDSGDDSTEHEQEMMIITDEDDSEFTLKLTEEIESRTIITIYLNTISDSDRLGKGILKIN